MSAKIVLSESKKEEIIKYIKNTYQCILNDASSHFGIRRDVIRREIGKENLNLIIFHGVKDSTKQKLRAANLGKTASEETRRKISDSEKIAQKKISKEKREEMCRKSKQTKIEKFGSWENYVKYQDSKTKQTKLERHGDENYNNKEKAGKTKLEKYGDINYNNLEQIKKTQEELYGGYAFCQRDRVKATMMERYGVEHNWASKDPKMNGRKTCYEKYGGKEEYYNHTLSKGRQTRLELYGDEFYSNSEKAQKTMLEKYGVRYFCSHKDCQSVSHTAEINQKRNETKRKNGTLNSSREQDETQVILKEYFGEDNIECEYQDDRYKNEETAWDMLNYVAKSGVIYSAFTTKISVCEDRHAFIGSKTCPICGKPVYDTYARVVG